MSLAVTVPGDTEGVGESQLQALILPLAEALRSVWAPGLGCCASPVPWVCCVSCRDPAVYVWPCEFCSSTPRPVPPKFSFNVSAYAIFFP